VLVAALLVPVAAATIAVARVVAVGPLVLRTRLVLTPGRLRGWHASFGGGRGGSGLAGCC
jgi:hypothetical protein